MAAPIQMFEASDGTVFKNHIDAVTHDRETDLKTAQEGVESIAETLVATLYSPCVLDEPEKSRRTTLEETTDLIREYVRTLQVLDDAKAAFNEPIAPIVAPAPTYVVPTPAPMPAPIPPANYEGLANDTMDRDVQLDEEDVQKKPRVNIRAALDARRARIQPPASVIRDDGMPETEDEELNENDILDAIM